MPKIKLITAMLIWGTVGLFVKFIPLSSAMTAFFRGIIGAVFLFLLLRLSGTKFSKEAFRRNYKLLLFSGACIGINWMLLFEAYNYTTVAIATLCYYFSPVFVTLLSPVLLKERLTPVKLLCIVVTLIGMVFVSGILEGDGNVNMLGILMATGAAVLYACVVLSNKFLRDISSSDATQVQLFVASAVLVPYILLTEDISAVSLDTRSILLLLAVGIFHTGIAFHLYFSSISMLKGQTIAIFSYIDPVVAILVSALVLREPLSFLHIIGAVLILGSTCLSELWEQKLFRAKRV